MGGRGSGYKQPGNWVSLKAHILKRDERICYLCGNEAHTVDHVVSVANGGTHAHDNLKAICTPCHDVKTEIERREGFARRLPRKPMAKNVEGHPNAPRKTQ